MASLLKMPSPTNENLSNYSLFPICSLTQVLKDYTKQPLFIISNVISKHVTCACPLTNRQWKRLI